MAKHRVRIVNHGNSRYTEVTDADTGNRIHGVIRAEISIDPDRDLGGEIVATLDVLAEIDITTSAEVRRLRLNAETGEYDEI